MSALTIHTTQNVNLEFTAAAVGTRIVAFLIDMVIKVAYGYIAISLMRLLGLGISFNDSWSQIAMLLILMSPTFFYTLIFETLLEGQTPGKRIMRIKVVKIDGFQATFPDFIARWLMRIVDVMFSSGAVALIAIITTERSQRLGDIVAGTAVINLKQKTTIDQTILMNLKETYQPVYAQAAYLSDNDARIIKDNFERALQSRDYELMYKLTQKIEEVLSIKKENKSDDAFIHQILSDFNYYTGAQ